MLASFNHLTLLQPYLQKCLETNIEPINRAGLVPTTNHIEAFSETLAQQSNDETANQLHSVLLRFNDVATLQSDFFMCGRTPVCHHCFCVIRMLTSPYAPFRCTRLLNTLPSTRYLFGTNMFVSSLRPVCCTGQSLTSAVVNI